MFLTHKRNKLINLKLFLVTMHQTCDVSGIFTIIRINDAYVMNMLMSLNLPKTRLD